MSQDPHSISFKSLPALIFGRSVRLWAKSGKIILVLCMFFSVGFFNCREVPADPNARVQIVKLIQSRLSLQKSGQEHEKEIIALDAEIVALLKKDPLYPVKINNQIELITLAFRNIGDGRARLDLVVRPLVKLKRAYTAYVYGSLDTANYKQLASSGDVSRLNKWPIPSEIDSTQWPPGGYVLLSQEVDAPWVPYFLQFNLFYKEPEKGWLKMVPQNLVLGWHVPD